MGQTICISAPQRRGTSPLPGGRGLAWYEWGPADGRPVLFCTGAGMSGGLGFGLEHLENLGIRLIGVDRAGLGASTPDPGKSFESWSADIARLASEKGLEEPCALGFSQGAPFALALAACGLVTTVAIVAGQDDLGHPALRCRLPDAVAALVDAARSDAAALESRLAAEATADWLWSMILRMSSQEDRALYGAPGFEGAYRACLDAGFLKGGTGYARDTVLALGHCPFAPEDIATPVQLWYGARDTSPVHSPDCGRTLCARLPDARLTVLDAGSAVLWTHSRRILEGLTGPAAAVRDRAD